MGSRQKARKGLAGEGYFGKGQVLSLIAVGLNFDVCSVGQDVRARSYNDRCRAFQRVPYVSLPFRAKENRAQAFLARLVASLLVRTNMLYFFARIRILLQS